MRKIRILVADGQKLYCEGISALLKGNSEIEVAGQACDGNEVLAKAREQRPDVILTDATLPVMNGVEVARQLREEKIDVRVLLLVQYENEEDILSVFRAGVNGIIPKKASCGDLFSAISAVSRGGYFIHPSIAKTIIHAYLHGAGTAGGLFGYERLTHRERQILLLIVEGSRTRDIASLLNIAVKTVVAHRNNIMKKLGIHRETELVKYAIRRHLINVGNGGREKREDA